MQGKTPKILYDGAGREKRIVITTELTEWLKQNRDESKTALAKALGVSRPTLYKLITDCQIAIPHKETKKEKVMRRLIEQVDSHVEKADAKQKKKIIKTVVDKVISGKSLLDIMRDEVKGKDGQTLTMNGEPLNYQRMLDLSLVNQAKESTQANISLRALVLALSEEEYNRKTLPHRLKFIDTMQKIATRKKSDMKRAMTSKGVWTDMVAGILDAWADSYVALHIAKANWLEAGGYTSENQITAQAQRNPRPSVTFEAYCKAQQTFGSLDQRLRTSCKDFYILVSGEDDATTALDTYISEISKIQ